MKKDSKKRRIVIALVHEALGTTLPEQKTATKRTAKALGFTVTDEYDRRVTSFLKYTKDLPRNAKTLDFHID